MIELAENYGERYIPLKEISESQDITVKYLEQIVSLLAKAELVVSTRGNSGGYKLSKKPSEYKILEIFSAAEGDFEAAPCDAGKGCERYRRCKAASFWQGLERAVCDYMNSQTLEDIVKNSRASSNRDPSIWIL